MGSEVSVWVPLGVGAFGFVGVLASQFLGWWRDDRRWGRDRAHYDSDRRFTARQDAYAAFLGAIERWDLALYPLVHGPTVGTAATDVELVGQLQRAAAATGEVLGPLVLVAPETIRTGIHDIVIPRHRVTAKVLHGDAESAELEQDWQICQTNYRAIRAMMRLSLGFDAETEYLDHPLPGASERATAVPGEELGIRCPAGRPAG